MMDWYGDGHGWLNGGGMFLMMLTWIVIIGLSVWLVTWLTRREKPVAKFESSRQILDRRLAAGDIDASAYAQARRLLEGNSPESNISK